MTMMPDLKHASTQLRERTAEHLARLQWSVSRFRTKLSAWKRCNHFLSVHGCPSNLHTLVYIMIHRIMTNSLAATPWPIWRVYTGAGYDMFEILTGNVVPGNEDDQSGSDDDQSGSEDNQASTGFPDAFPDASPSGVAHGRKRLGSELADTRRKKGRMNAGDAVLAALTRHEARTALEQRRFRREVEEALKKGFAGRDGQLQADIASHDHAQGDEDVDFHNEIAGRKEGVLQNQTIQDSDSHILRAVGQGNGYIEDGEEELEDVYKNQAVRGGAGRIYDWLQNQDESYARDDEEDAFDGN